MTWLRRLLNRLRGKPMPATRAILDAMTVEATGAPRPNSGAREWPLGEVEDAAIERALAEMRVDMQPVTRDLPVYAKCPCEVCVVKRMRTGHGEITGRN